MKSSALAALLVAALTAVHSRAAPAQPKAAKSLCEVSETILFTCQVKTKTVSICGQGQGRAIYRFGRPGRVELKATDLHLASQGFSGGGETQVYADTPTHRYIVYYMMVRTGFGADGHNDPKEMTGLVVQSEGQTISSRECALPKTYDPLSEVLDQQRIQVFVPAGDYVPH